jgi:hypothetical protein
MSLLWIGCLALAGCVGEIGGSEDADSQRPPSSTTGELSCDPSASALTASPIHRIAKSYLQNAVLELLSPLSDDQRAAVLTAIQSRLALIPTDQAVKKGQYAENDDSVTQDHVDAIFGLAVALGSHLGSSNRTYDEALLTPCGAGLDRSALSDDACLTSFIKYYGRKTLRRPLTDAEIADFKSFAQEAKSKQLEPMSALFGRFVAHPRFYYRFDSEGALAQGTESVDAVYQLTSWELLSKLTFLFWAAPPSDALYDRMATFDVADDAALGTLIDDVLSDPRAERGIQSFYRQWLLLEKTKMPATDGNIAAGNALIAAAGLDALPASHREDMIQEVLDLTTYYTLTTPGTLNDVLLSQTSFARTPALATIYGVAPWDGSKDHLVTLPQGERSGLLTRAALLATNTEYTRPILKGKEIRTRLFCDDIQLPPPNLKITPLVHPVDKTTRQVTEEATGNATCGGCHGQMNPLGFASEGFDPIGRARSSELRFSDGTGDIAAELPLDTRVTVDLGGGKKVEVADAMELSQAVADSGRVQTCMVRNYFELVTGRIEDNVTDGCDLVGLRDRLTSAGGSIQAMLKQSALLPSFRSRKVK